MYIEWVRPPPLPPSPSLSPLKLNKVNYGRQAINRAKRAFSILLVTAGPKRQVLYTSEYGALSIIKYLQIHRHVFTATRGNRSLIRESHHAQEEKKV